MGHGAAKTQAPSPPIQPPQHPYRGRGLSIAEVYDAPGILTAVYEVYPTRGRRPTLPPLEAADRTASRSPSPEAARADGDGCTVESTPGPRELSRTHVLQRSPSRDTMWEAPTSCSGLSSNVETHQSASDIYFREPGALHRRRAAGGGKKAQALANPLLSKYAPTQPSRVRTVHVAAEDPATGTCRVVYGAAPAPHWAAADAQALLDIMTLEDARRAVDADRVNRPRSSGADRGEAIPYIDGGLGPPSADTPNAVNRREPDGGARALQEILFLRKRECHANAKAKKRVTLLPPPPGAGSVRAAARGSAGSGAPWDETDGESTVVSFPMESICFSLPYGSAGTCGSPGLPPATRLTDDGDRHPVHALPPLTHVPRRGQQQGNRRALPAAATAKAPVVLTAAPWEVRHNVGDAEKEYVGQPPTSHWLTSPLWDSQAV
ncbi:hypothetical protein STCU_10052 [Strigomonas culicis]|uniref:Uncharacterized protein n=1 Tax=Strigomonas culicis TaxID=28005 RepID=S9TNN3_9TRYP|nr:hypothetical protein STCU_10052 [Strigomonas culicis]|eukprot:EPY18329.1 hypothetical protein STCU_10052 [Strigomonas culicis]